MVDFVHSFHHLLDCNHNDMGKVNLELEGNLVQNTVEKMLEQFVLQKYTGLVKPGGPPSDISDRSANSDKLSIDKGSTGNKKENSGFLKNRRKKDRKKSSNKAKDETESENKDIGSDGEERGRSETPTPEHNDEEEYKNPPRPSEGNDPWADFNQGNKKSFYSSSDSDTDDEEVKKIKINIRPVAAGPARAATSASVDELQKAVGGIDLNAATLPKRPTPSIEVESGGVKRSQSTVHVAKGSHAQDLLGLFPVLDSSTGADVSSADILSASAASATTELHVSGGLPGAESTRLDSSEVSHHSNTSKEVSDLLNDIQDLNNDIQDDTKNVDIPPELPSSQPPPVWPDSSAFSWPETPPVDSSSGLGESVGPSQFNLEDSTSFGESTQPPLPQKTRPMSAQREKVANSLIPLPRPPSRARPEPRLRGTPSPTPTSLLQSTALSVHRSDSTVLE